MALPRIGTVEKGEYNPGLGMYIRNRGHLKDELKRRRDAGRDIIEVGDEPPEKIYKSLESEREKRRAARWAEPVEKMLHEVNQ